MAGVVKGGGWSKLNIRAYKVSGFFSWTKGGISMIDISTAAMLRVPPFRLV